ncbi:MAG: helix-turn-helix domain-containing protein [Planctomycetota bacterium]
MPTPISPDLRRRILEAARAADHDSSASLTVSSLAEYVGVSDKHFQRAFRQVFDESPKQYIRRVRLQSAAYLLKWSDADVTQIALLSGFDTHAGFTKAFTRAYGRSPSAFREALGVVPYMNARVTESRGDDADSVTLEASRLLVRVERTPARRVAAMRHIGPAESCVEVWPRMVEWAKACGLLDKDSVLLGIHNDYWDANSEDKYRYDAAIVVDDDFSADNHVTTFVLPDGPVAMTEFDGSFHEADLAWRRFVDQWLPASGLLPRARFAYDVYPVDLIDAGPLARLMQTLIGIRATLCLPVVET